MALNLTGTTAEDDNQYGAPLDPAGCYFEGGKLKMNVKGGNTGYCSSRDKCLCQGPTPVRTGHPTFIPTDVTKLNSNTPTVIPTTGFPMTRAPTPLPYVLVTSGQCAIYINTTLECGLAAVALGQPDTSVLDDGKSRSTSVPPGCYSQSMGLFDSLKINVDSTNTGTCSRRYKCLCKMSITSYPTTLPTNTEPPTQPPSLVPSHVPTSQLEHQDLALLIERCNSMTNMAFSESMVKVVGITGQCVLCIHVL